MIDESESLIRPYDQSIRLAVFEGPLDLLLFLIRKNEIDIYDIPISSVTEQYLEILHGMKELQLEVAGEFFVMAASLMQIKSRMLLPRQEPTKEDLIEDHDERIDPRWELVQQLIEYKKFKEATTALYDLSTEARDCLPRLVNPPKDQEPEIRPLYSVDKIEVWNLFNIVLRRLAEKMQTGTIEEESVSVSDRMEFILDRLKSPETFLFTSLFSEGKKTSLLTIIASFLALLELTRLKKITLVQNEAFCDIEITPITDAEAGEMDPKQIEIAF
jgi:segregation and condensation protein A